MREPDDDFLYIFLHVPKSAGTHFVRTVTFDLPFTDYLMMTPTLQHPFRSRHEVDDFLDSMPSERKESARFLFGHAVYHGIHRHFERTPRYITFLRDPCSRSISNYLHIRRNYDYFVAEGVQKLPDNEEDFSFDWWLRNNQCNLQTAMILNYGIDDRAGWEPGAQLGEEHLKQAQQILENFYFLGLQESFEEDSLFLFSRLGVRHSLVDRQNLSEESAPGLEIDEQALATATALDRRLYEHATELNWAFKREYRSFSGLVERMQGDMRAARPVRYLFINQMERILGQRRALRVVESMIRVVKGLVGERNVFRLIKLSSRLKRSERPQQQDD